MEGRVTQEAVRIRRLEASNAEDFWRLHSEDNGAGWCCCAAWWTPSWEGWGERSAEQNRALRLRLFQWRIYDGYLCYVDGEVAGWCQCLPRDRLEKLRRQYDLEEDPEAWALSCFLMAPPYRGRSLCRRLLEAVLADLRLQGVKRVEAFPRRGDCLPEEDLWTGPEGLFREAGFSLLRDHERFPVYELALDANAAGPRESATAGEV